MIYATLSFKQVTVSFMDLGNWTPMFASTSAFLVLIAKVSGICCTSNLFCGLAASLDIRRRRGFKEKEIDEK